VWSYRFGISKKCGEVGFAAGSGQMYVRKGVSNAVRGEEIKASSIVSYLQGNDRPSGLVGAAHFPIIFPMADGSVDVRPAFIALSSKPVSGSSYRAINKCVPNDPDT